MLSSKQRLKRIKKKYGDKDSDVVEFIAGIFKNLVHQSRFDKEIDKATFMRYFPLTGLLAERLFAIFDNQKLGRINIDEFIDNLMAFIGNNKERKIKMLYDMFNMDDSPDGITYDELYTFLNNMVLSSFDIKNVDEILSQTTSRLKLTPISAPLSPITTTTDPATSAPTSPSNRTSTMPVSIPKPELHLEFSKSRSSPLAWAPPLGASPPLATRYARAKSPFTDFETSSIDMASMDHFFEGEYDSLASLIELIDYNIKVNANKAVVTLDGLELDYQESHYVSTSLTRFLKFTFDRYKLLPGGSMDYKTFKAFISENEIIFDLMFERYCFRRHDLDFIRSREKISPILLSESDASSSSSRTTVHGSLNSADPATASESQRHNFEAMFEDSDTKFSTVMGYLSKKGDGNRLYKRYYVLQKHLLYYFLQPTDLAPRGVIDVTHDQVFLINDGKRFGFRLRSESLDRLFLAPSLKEATSWCDAITQNKAVKQNIEDIYDVYGYAKILGQGGFATVYEATHRASQASVAVKVVNKMMLNHVEKNALISEVALLKIARHPNVLHFYEVVETAELLYIVTEVCNHGELLTFIQDRKGPLNRKLVYSITKQLLSAIKYLHDLGMVHRDIKPSNILLTTKDQASLENDDFIVKVADYGSSQFSAYTDSLSDPVGTMRYYPPEMLKTQQYNHAMDMWGCGIIFYMMLCGIYPFTGADDDMIMYNIECNRYNTTNDAFKNALPVEKEFLRGLLNIDPTLRLTAARALAHPYITSFEASEQ